MTEQSLSNTVLVAGGTGLLASVIYFYLSKNKIVVPIKQNFSFYFKNGEVGDFLTQKVDTFKSWNEKDEWISRTLKSDLNRTEIKYKYFNNNCCVKGKNNESLFLDQINLTYPDILKLRICMTQALWGAVISEIQNKFNNTLFFRNDIRGRLIICTPNYLKSEILLKIAWYHNYNINSAEQLIKLKAILRWSDNKIDDLSIHIEKLNG